MRRVPRPPSYSTRRFQRFGHCRCCCRSRCCCCCCCCYRCCYCLCLCYCLPFFRLLLLCLFLLLLMLLLPSSLTPSSARVCPGTHLLFDARRPCRRFRAQIRSQWERTLTGDQKAFLKDVHDETEASRKAPAQSDRAKQRSERKELLRQKQEARAARMRGGGGSGGSGS